VQANGTVLEARFDDFLANVGGRSVSLAGNVPLNVPERSANLLLFYDATRALQGRAVLRYVGTRFADNTNSPASRIPAYSVLDLGTRWKATPRLSFDLRVDNALDETYADSGSATAWVLGAPRSATLSANVLF
jgi:iron complex outermembrane receptor protein